MVIDQIAAMGIDPKENQIKKSSDANDGTARKIDSVKPTLMEVRENGCLRYFSWPVLRRICHASCKAH